jgi:hypothetical protein
LWIAGASTEDAFCSERDRANDRHLHRAAREDRLLSVVLPRRSLITN